MLSKLWARSLSFILTIMASASVAADRDVFTMTMTTRNQTKMSVEGRAPILDAGEGKLSGTLNGVKASECADYGRVASAVATAESTLISSTASSISLEMHISAITKGGHYRTCLSCGEDVVSGVRNVCLIIKGNDTDAEAEASATARVAIKFNEELAYNRYEVKLATSGRSDLLAVRLTGPNTDALFSATQTGIKIEPKRGDVYFVEIRMAAAAKNSGGCCTDDKSGGAGVVVRVEKSPILSAYGNFEPFLVGGALTSAFENVVAILIDGQMHCTGTVIGPRTVLTAAHCLHLHEGQIRENRMTVLFGPSVRAPAGQPIPVKEFDYPRGPQIRFNPDRSAMTHDIGVVYVERPMPGAQALLHAAEPSLEVGLTRQQFTFVGYGYTRESTGIAGLGEKREGKFPIAGVETTRFFYRVDKFGACKGDSGGPTFMDNPAGGPQFLVGVTSGGWESCTSGGVQTRVDAHRSWIDPRIQ